MLKKLLVAIATVVAVAAPYFIYPIFLAQFLCFALFASALNLLLGYTGLLSFGHAAFFGGSAYVAAHAMKVWGLPFELSILAGVGVAALLGVVFGVIAIRRQGIYFAMTTLALAQMVYFAALQLPFTGGENGIQGVPRGYLLGTISLEDHTTLYFVVLAITVGALLGLRRLVHSPFGQVLASIRQNERRATSLGYRPERYKVAAFVISAALAGLAGSMKAVVFQIATLNDVHWTMSGEVVLMTIVGGVGTLLGPIIGAGVITGTHDLLAESGGQWALVIQGCIFVAIVMAFRRGIVGELAEYIRNRREALARRRASPVPAAQERIRADD